MQFGIDRRGSLWVSFDPGLWLGFLPVTKVEFEAFLCARPLSVDAGSTLQFDEEWYATRLAQNLRVPWHQTDRASRLGTFMTAVSVGEAGAYCRWLGPGFQVQRWRDWLKAWQRGVDEIPREHLVRLAQAAADFRYGAILQRLAASSAAQPLREAMLLGDGLLELVSVRRETWGEIGSLPHFLPPNPMPTDRPGALLTESSPCRGFRVTCHDADLVERLDD
jgi:hypothetical protein